MRLALRALRWALSQPTDTLTLGMMTNAEVDANLATAAEWYRTPPDQAELDALVEQWRPQANRDNFYWR